MNNELNIVYLLLFAMLSLCSFLLLGTNMSIMVGGAADKMSEVPEFYSF